MQKNQLSKIFLGKELLPPKEGVSISSKKVSKTIWDDTEGALAKYTDSHSDKLYGQYESLKENLKKPKEDFDDAKKKALPFYIVGGLLLASFFFIGQAGLFIGITIIGVGAAISSGVTGYYKRLTYDLIKLDIAIKNKWSYFPEKSKTGWNSLVHKYPEIFRKGDRGQHLEDVFLGHVNYQNKKFDFNSGLFYYEVRHTDSKGRTYYTTETRNYLTVKLNKKINTRFALVPEGLGIFSKLGRKEINTESVEFNKAFRFSYQGKKEEKQHDIIKILTPVVIDSLTNLHRVKKTCEVLFTKDTITFMFKGRVLPHIFTNLTRGEGFDKRDEENLEQSMNIYFDIVKEIYKTLD